MPERTLQGQRNGGRVVASRERVDGTPSRKEKGRESLAVQDPGLKDYRLGECIGKGAFGAVYKAFNWGTGEAVAVKQIRLGDLPKSELRMIESEIDLLKNLLHANIVKYIGFVKTTECLNIILEYCENGSLHSICKAYGKFPENLVGVYMTQVLQGLQYLHDQGVIHRDIKGANILTTKDGTVKLADFGVSTSTLASGQDKEAQVVGTPYWMAPEIIQLSGASSASDIWSVGCTVIELLQGKPPYHNLAAMPALFAIVNDDHPPLPEGISAAARDFLMQCFQKDPNLRVTARKLLKHAWIVGCRRADVPVSKAPDNFTQAVEEVKQWNKALESSEPNFRASSGSENAASALRYQSGTPAKGPLSLAKSKPGAGAFMVPEMADDDNWDNDFATAISPSALQLPHLKGQDNFGGLLSSDRLKSFAYANEDRNDSNYDDDFEGELMTIRGPSFYRDFDSQEKTIRPSPRQVDRLLADPSPRSHRRTKSSLDQPYRGSHLTKAQSPPKPAMGAGFMSNKFELPSRPDLVYREQSVEDYSDLFVDNDSVFDQAPNSFETSRKPEPRQADSPRLFHPSDLTSLPRSMMQPPDQHHGNLSSLRTNVINKNNGKPTGLPTRPSVRPDKPLQRARSSIEIQKFAEDDDEDFSDVFGPASTGLEKEESELGGPGSDDGKLMLMSKISSSNSWLGDDEDEDDPFASMDPGWDEMDLEANIARDRHARLAEKVESLVRELKFSEGEDELSELSEELLMHLWENAEAKNMILSAHGLMPILEILEPCTVKSRQYMILQLLKVVNAIILDDVETQENLCFVGGIPIITKFAARQYSNEIRLEAAAFVRQMYQTSTLTLQMFVSAGGLNVLVEFLDEDYDSARDLVLIGVNGVWNVFELQGPTPKNDFCRIFSRSKILYPLALVLHRVLDEEGEDELGELIEGRIVNIFYLFSQAENYVKEVVADRQVLKSVLKDLRRMTPIHQITMLKFIKNLSMLSTTLQVLHSADAIEFLIDLLSYSMKKGQQHFREISNQVLTTMFNLCRLNKERQEDAAVGGIIPLLLRILKTDRPPKEFALPILCDMAHSGSKGRRYLWQNNGLAFYVSLLTDQYWQVTALDAILIWLQEETANVESHLLDGEFTRAIVGCFGTNRLNAFDSNLLEPLLKLLRLSPSIAASLARPEMFAGMAQRLGHKKAVVRLNLLRLVRIIMDAAGPGLGRGDGSQTLNTAQVRVLMESIQTLAEADSAVLVRNLAADLVRSHIGGGNSAMLMLHDGLVAASPSSVSSSASSVVASSAASAQQVGAGGAMSVSRRASRRNTSYTPSAFHHPAASSSAGSTPQTPTHRRSRASLATNAPILESAVSASPRRSTALEREGSIYRPRSRDGPTGLPRRVVNQTSESRLPRSSTPPVLHSRSSRPVLREMMTTPTPVPVIPERSPSSLSKRSHHKENSTSSVASSASSSSAATGSRQTTTTTTMPRRERTDSMTSTGRPGASAGLGYAASKRRPREMRWS